MTDTDNFTFYFVVNADNRIGSGHLKRCLRIADELRSMVSGIRTFFVSWSLHESFKNSIEPHAVRIIDRANLLLFFREEATSVGKSWIVVDSDENDLHDISVQAGLKSLGYKMAYFTVSAKNSYSCDVLINPSILASYQNYGTSQSTVCLFGPGYMVFDRDFRRQQIRPPREAGRKIFIGFGGADPMGYTSRVLEAILRYADGDVLATVVLGRMAKGISHLRSIERQKSDQVKVFHDVQDVRSIMEECDVAICSPGTTFWELAILGIKSIILPSSPREVETAELLDSLGYAKLLTQFNEELSAEKLFQQLWEGHEIAPKLKDLQRLIEPNGVANIVKCFLNFPDNGG